MSAPDPTSPSARSRGTRRWLVALLVASLAVNLVVIGAALAERIWPAPDERVGFHRSVHLLPRQFFAELDGDRRDELTAVFKEKRSEFRDERGGLRDAASAFAEALERDPFDPGLAQAAIVEHASRSRRLVDFGATVAEDVVGALTPEERQALADAIRTRLEHGRERARTRRSR